MLDDDARQSICVRVCNTTALKQQQPAAGQGAQISCVIECSLPRSQTDLTADDRPPSPVIFGHCRKAPIISIIIDASRQPRYPPTTNKSNQPTHTHIGQMPINGPIIGAIGAISAAWSTNVCAPHIASLANYLNRTNPLGARGMRTCAVRIAHTYAPLSSRVHREYTPIVYRPPVCRCFCAVGQTVFVCVHV